MEHLAKISAWMEPSEEALAEPGSNLVNHRLNQNKPNRPLCQFSFYNIGKCA